MADLTITAANVIPVSGYRFKTLPAAAAITIGQALYVDSSNQWALADADAVTTAACTGISLTQAAAASQPVRAIVGGNLGLGAILTVGTPYVASTTAGGIAPYSDLGSGDFPTFIGWATTTSNLKLTYAACGAAKP